MTFRNFERLASENEQKTSPPWRYYMQTALLLGLTKKRGLKGGGKVHTPLGTLEHGAFGPDVVSDLHRLGWDWLARACATGRCEGFHSCTVRQAVDRPPYGRSTPVHNTSVHRADATTLYIQPFVVPLRHILNLTQTRLTGSSPVLADVGRVWRRVDTDAL